MSNMMEGLLYAWAKNLDYGQRLIGDLSEEQLIQQPVDNGVPANHPAWVFSHLNVYLPVIESLVEGNEFEDPKGHRFGMQSQPEMAAGVYAPKQQLLDEFVEGHEKVEAALRSTNDEVFSRPMSLERWRTPMPTVGIALPYLMLAHENQHFGQISAWRRVLGLPSV